MSWTDERIEQLKQLWESGMTASQIAEALGGVSRNAVIGKAHRLGLQARPSPVRPNEPAPAAEPASAPAPDVTGIAPADSPPFDTAPLDELPIEEEEEEEDEGEEALPAAGGKSGTEPQLRSIGPGGFVRQGPGDQQPPIPPAPPRRLVPAKPSSEVANKTSLLDLNEKICKWPMGHPGEPDFHFCGASANPGFPYCVEHCSLAYQAQLPRRDRRPPPPLPYGGPRVR